MPFYPVAGSRFSLTVLIASGISKSDLIKKQNIITAINIVVKK